MPFLIVKKKQFLLKKYLLDLFKKQKMEAVSCGGKWPYCTVIACQKPVSGTVLGQHGW